VCSWKLVAVFVGTCLEGETALLLAVIALGGFAWWLTRRIRARSNGGSARCLRLA